MVDVVIVGASIAGAATAIHLARLGHSVQVLEATQFPSRKACGEGLSPQGVAELDRLGVLPGLMPQASVLRAIQFELNGATVEAPLGTPARPALGVQRSLLDAAMADAASQIGVEVLYGVRATGLVAGDAGFAAVETNAGGFDARVILAADGAGSRLRHAAGLDAAAKHKRYGVSAHYRLQAPATQRIEVHFRKSYEVYITPVDASLVNVAVLLGRAQASALSGRLLEGYKELVSSARALPEGAERIDEPLVAGPFPASAKRAWRDNLVLVGDAAGFFDGITGEGMSLGLTGAACCAKAVHRYLNGGGADAFAAYDRERRAAARNSTLLAHLNLILASHPLLGRRAVDNVARHPATFAKLVAINQGQRGLASLTPRDLLALTLGL